MNKILSFLLCVMCVFTVGCQRKEEVVDLKEASGESDTKISGENNLIDSSDIFSGDENSIDNDENESEYNRLEYYDAYIFPNSATQKIEKDELKNLHLNELEKAKNEIFARHGHDFSSKSLKEYFIGKSWYKAVPGKKVTVSELNKIEQANVELIDKEIVMRKDVNRYIKLNRTSIDDMPDYFEIRLAGVDIGIRIGERTSTITNLKNGNSVEKDFCILDTFEDRYLMIVGGPSEDCNMLEILDTDLISKVSAPIYDDMYKVINDKIELSHYQWVPHEEISEDDPHRPLTPMYRVDYEIVKDGNEFKLNKIKEDRNDIKYTAGSY